MARLSDYDMGRAMELIRQGRTQRAVADELNRSPSVIHRLVKRHNETGETKYRHGGIHPRITTRNEDRAIVAETRHNPRVTTTTLKTLIPRPISRRTIVRRLHERGIKSFRPVVKPLLTERHRAARRDFASTHATWTIEQWRKCLFTDESRIELHTNTRSERVWRRPGERMAERFVNRSRAFGGGSITVWGGITMNSRTQLVIFRNQTVNSRNYISNILEPVVIPTANRIGDGFIFIDDNAPCHRARIVNDYLASRQINRSSWPAQSPDLNPIENVWAMLKSRVRSYEPPPRTLDALEAVIIEMWNAVPQEMIAAAIGSMKRRCLGVIRARGGSIKY